MVKDNKTANRVQAIWNMVGGDSVVDDLLCGKAKMRIQYDSKLSVYEHIIPILSRQEAIEFFAENKNMLCMEMDFQTHVLKTDDISEADDEKILKFGHVDVAANEDCLARLPAAYEFVRSGTLARLIGTLISDYDSENELLTKAGPNIFYLLKGKNKYLVIVSYHSRKWNCYCKSITRGRRSIWPKKSHVFVVR